MSQFTILASFMAFVLIYSIFMIVEPRKETVEDRVKRLSSEKQDATNTPRKVSFKDYLTKLSKFTPRKWAERIDKELHASGIPLTGGEFVTLQLFLVILFSLMALALMAINMIVIFLPLLSLVLPQIYINVIRSKRLRLFGNQLADVLLVLANSLKAGFSLFQAMDMASQEMPDPIASELRITLKEMTYGASTETALMNLNDRVGSRDLDLMITAIMIQRQIGGNLAEILMNIHDTIQQRIRIQGEVKTLTAQGRLSGYIIGALPILIGLAITVMQPEYLSVLFNSTIGMALIGLGLTFQIIGFLIIRNIVNIKF